MNTSNSLFLTRMIAIVVGIIESAILFFTPQPIRAGLDQCLFMLPAAVVMVLVVYPNILGLHKGGIALKIYYCVVMIRYMVLPWLILISKGKCGYYMPAVKSPYSYWFAIILMVIELFISISVINKHYYIEEDKILNKIEMRKYPGKSISGVGVVVIGMLVLLLIVRANYVIPSMNIILIKDANADAGVWYEAIIMNCLKAFLFASIMQVIYKLRSAKDKFLYFFIAVVLALLNFGIYFGSNRAYIVMTLIATVFIYLHIYPEYKFVSLVALIPVGVICVFTMFVNKQFGLEVSEMTSSVVDIAGVSNIIELYVGGPWNYASGLEAVTGRYLPDVGMIIASFLQKFALLNIPGFKWLRHIENSMTPMYGTDVYAWDAYHTSLGIYGNSQILSGSTEILVMFGWIIGILMVFVYQYWVSKMLIRIDCRAKHINHDMRYKYMYVWLGVMFGMFYCYSPALLLWVWSKFAMFYWLLVYANDKFIFGRR